MKQTRITMDISGMGGNYEATCQKMLAIGLKWIKDKPTSIWNRSGPTHAKSKDGKTIIEVYGLFQSNKQLKPLENIWHKEIKDYTGAMHEAVMRHLTYIHKNGYDTWLKDARNTRSPEDFYKVKDATGQRLEIKQDRLRPVKQFNSSTQIQEATNGNKDKGEDTRLPDVQGERTMETAAIHVLEHERGTDRARSQGQDRGLHEKGATGGRVN